MASVASPKNVSVLPKCAGQPDLTGVFSDLSDVISYTTDKMSGASVVAVFCV